MQTLVRRMLGCSCTLVMSSIIPDKINVDWPRIDPFLLCWWYGCLWLFLFLLAAQIDLESTLSWQHALIWVWNLQRRPRRGADANHRVLAVHWNPRNVRELDEHLFRKIRTGEVARVRGARGERLSSFRQVIKELLKLLLLSLQLCHLLLGSRQFGGKLVNRGRLGDSRRTANAITVRLRWFFLDLWLRLSREARRWILVPRDLILAPFLYQPNPLEYVGNVIDASLLNPQFFRGNIQVQCIVI